MKKTVAIVEDDSGLRNQLIKILGSASDIECIGNFTTGEEALKHIPENLPDVVLMDIKLPGMSGIQCVSELKSLLPKIQIVMVTVYEDSERIFKALKAGANGYLIKSSPPEQLLEAVRDAYRGGAPMSSPIAQKVVQYFHSVAPTSADSENLSPRERQVLELLSSGFIYKEIGDQLNIGVETVRTYVKGICNKMHVRSRLEAIAKFQNKSEPRH